MNLKRLLLAAAVVVIPATAHATEDFCTSVAKTSDGFLALRAGPGVQSRLIIKLHENDLLDADTWGNHKSWVRINAVHRNGKLIFDANQNGVYSPGFVAEVYTNNAPCFEDELTTAQTVPPGVSGRQNLYTCYGRLDISPSSGRGSGLRINCIPPKGQESGDLTLRMLPAKDRAWIIKVCGDPRKRGFCRVQVIANEGSDTEDDTSDALQLLHVTNKPKFSWE
jgi:hypothetical protein